MPKADRSAEVVRALFETSGLPLAKYVPVTPSTFGEDARYTEVAAPCCGVFMNGL
jgi:hypothetical protein